MYYYKLRAGVSGEELEQAGFERRGAVYRKIIPLGATRWKITARLIVRCGDDGQLLYDDSPKMGEPAIWDGLQNRVYEPAYHAKPRGYVDELLRRYRTVMEEMSVFERVIRWV